MLFSKGSLLPWHQRVHIIYSTSAPGPEGVVASSVPTTVTSIQFVSKVITEKVHCDWLPVLRSAASKPPTPGLKAPAVLFYHIKHE